MRVSLTRTAIRYGSRPVRGERRSELSQSSRTCGFGCEEATDAAGREERVLRRVPYQGSSSRGLPVRVGVGVGASVIAMLGSVRNVMNRPQRDTGVREIDSSRRQRER